MIPTLKPPRRTILVVEDALTTRCILEQFFARAGCDVVQASDPESAMKRLKATSVDAVILDLRLSDERSGLEVLEQMRLDERFDDVPVVVLTGVTEVDQAEEESHPAPSGASAIQAFRLPRSRSTAREDHHRSSGVVSGT